MPQRILSISGLRGIIGDGLDPLYVVEFAAAVGTMALTPGPSPKGRGEKGEGGTVVLTRDGRCSGTMLRDAVLAGLTAAGCRVIDAGVASTPTCGVLVDHLGASGGLQITASHNPVEWNGLKPFSSDGSVFNEEQGKRLLDILETRSFRWTSWDGLGTVESFDEAADIHWERIRNHVDVDGIRQRKLNVVLDCNHGSGAVLGPRLLKELGCKVHVLGGTPDGRFEHEPEPLRENLTGLCDAVSRHRADVGFAQDPDADRLAIVDNTGRYIGEELTLALCADYVLSRIQKPGFSEKPGFFGGGIVVNSSTSRATADIAAKYGSPFHHSRVGEANVVAKMREVSAVLGGEGNGGVIEPKVGWVRDSFVAMAYVLAGLAEREGTLAEWADSLPQYAIVKEKLPCPREQVEEACSALRSAFTDATPAEDDGLRLDWPDRWVQVRASNTEPILRVIAEAPDQESAAKLAGEAVQIVRTAIGV